MEQIQRDRRRLAFRQSAAGIHFVEIAFVEVVEEPGFVWRIVCEAAGGHGKKHGQN